MTEDVDTDLASLLLTKKKKKKKGAINFAKLEVEAATLAAQSADQSSENNIAAAAEPVSNHVESASIQQPAEYPQSPLSPVAATPSDMREEMIQATIVTYSYELPLKKKRRRPNVTFEGFESVNVLIDEVEDATRGAEGAELGDDLDLDTTDTSTWAGTDRDYTYEELLDRVFSIMKQKNPNMVDRKTKLVMKPPQVVRVGAKKTSFANFTDICKMLHRQPKHLLAFLLAELGTSGSVDGNNQLIIKGKFQQKQIETVLRRYIREYVTCHTCKSPQTFLQKDSRLFFLQCETCGSRCSVASIKSGFQAVTSHRAQLRAKQ